MRTLPPAQSALLTEIRCNEVVGMVIPPRRLRTARALATAGLITLRQVTWEAHPSGHVTQYMLAKPVQP